MEKIKLALVRGDSLKEQESQVWEGMTEKFEVKAFCGKKNVFPLNDVKLPYERLSSTADNFFKKNFFKYFFGQYQRMTGLEATLKNFDIAHGVEAYNYYTLQCVRAKKLNPKLKVVSNFSDNTFGRFEYNYWPGFKVSPKYWRDQINSVIKENIAGVDIFLAFTKYAEELLYDLGAKKQQVVLAYPGVNVDETGDDLVDTLGLRDKEFYLVICRMIWEKGIYDILYAWKMFMKGSNSDRKLVMVGNGRERENLKRLVKDLGLESSVIIAGSIPNTKVKQLYRHAHAFVLGSAAVPSWQEQCPYVLIESLLHNCPIICSTSGGNPELTGSAGIVVPASNPVEYRKAFEKMEDKEFYKTLKENCTREKVRFDIGNYRKKLEEVYLSLL